MPGIYEQTNNRNGNADSNSRASFFFFFPTNMPFSLFLEVILQTRYETNSPVSSLKPESCSLSQSNARGVTNCFHLLYFFFFLFYALASAFEYLHIGVCISCPPALTLASVLNWRHDPNTTVRPERFRPHTRRTDTNNRLTLPVSQSSQRFTLWNTAAPYYRKRRRWLSKKPPLSWPR